MGAETRLAVVLFGSFVLWIPALSSVLRGELDAGVAGIRWGVGAALVWAMVAALNQLIAGYAVAPTDDDLARRATDGQPDSRRADRSDGARPADEADEVVDAGGDTVEGREAADDDGADLLGDAATTEAV